MFARIYEMFTVRYDLQDRNNIFTFVSPITHISGRQSNSCSFKSSFYCFQFFLFIPFILNDFHTRLLRFTTRNL